MRLQYGNLSSPKADFAVSDVWGKFAAALDGSVFNTDGFPIVIENERGPIDTKATVEYRNLNARVDYSPIVAGERVRSAPASSRRSATTPSSRRSTAIRKPTTPTGIPWPAACASPCPIRATFRRASSTDFETFHSNFLAVPNPTTRAIGRMTLLQEVPTTGVGAMVQWSKALSSRSLFSAGGDFRHVEGASNEQVLDPLQGLTVTLLRESGGDAAHLRRLRAGPVLAAPEALAHRSALAWTTGRTPTGATSKPRWRPVCPRANNRTLPDKSDTVVSPRAAVLYHVSDKVSAFGSISSGFRAPTLNELYRQFRVGTVLTLANDQLGPERLVGGEVGVNVAPSENFTFRSSWYDNRVENPVANVTTTAPCNTLPAAPESGPHAHLGLAERRRVPHQPRRCASAPATCSTRPR